MRERLSINRDQYEAFLRNDNAAIRQFEALFRDVNALNNAFAYQDVTDSSVDVSSDLGEFYYCDATAGPITVNLPSLASFDTRIGTIKKTDASGNAVTVTANGSDTIDGAATKVLAAQYDTITIHATSSSWRVISEL